MLTEGEVRSGDPIEVVHRPARSLSIAEAFHIYVHEPRSPGRLLEAEGLPDGLRTEVEHRLSRVG